MTAYVNAQGGSAEPAMAALGEAKDFVMRTISPEGFGDALREEVARGTPRVLVVGGDGTVATAASVLAHTATELAILPAGTRNHFARDHGIPDQPARALELARTGTARPVDAGWVNDRLFINTSSVGIYVNFVRAREGFERYVGYRLASVIAAVAILFRVRRFRVVLEAERQRRAFETPLVFVGVGERSLGLPSPGARTADDGGDTKLHVLVPRPGIRVTALASRYAAARIGTRTGGADRLLAAGMLTDRCTIELPRARGRVALDGEVVILQAPLEYRIGQRVLRVVLPDQ